MFQPTVCVMASAADRAQLEQLATNGRTPQKTALRARIVLMLATGAKPAQVARSLGISRMRVRLWLQRYIAAGVRGLMRDATRPPGRYKPLSPERIAVIVEMTLQTKPAQATHWTTRTMAKAVGISEAMVRRIWHQHGLQPHRLDRFKQSKDPRFVEKLRDIVGLYLHPPAKAVVFSVDEKSNIQALDRTRPVLALQPHVPERQTHDYIRHGTTTLFAALRLLDGVVIGECHARHRTKEFLTFLKRLDRETPAELDLHLIVDNSSTHKSPPVRRWLRRHPRVHFHFTPTSSSWLNLVERWFAEITRTRLRRGTFESLPTLLRAIREYLDHYNRSPKPFVWTKDADTILGKIARVSNR
jgi:transposase